MIQENDKFDNQSLENGKGRQNDINRHITKQSTSRMCDSLGMFPVQYEKNSFITVGLDAS